MSLLLSTFELSFEFTIIHRITDVQFLPPFPASLSAPFAPFAPSGASSPKAPVALSIRSPTKPLALSKISPKASVKLSKIFPSSAFESAGIALIIYEKKNVIFYL